MFILFKAKCKFCEMQMEDVDKENLKMRMREHILESDGQALDDELTTTSAKLMRRQYAFYIAGTLITNDS